MKPVKIGSVKGLKDFLFYNMDFLFIVLLLTVIVFANSLNGDFVSDDLGTIINNPLTNNLTGALKTFNGQQIIYSLINKIFGLNKFVFHLFSLSMHVLVIFLVFLFFSIILSVKHARIAALLFSVHPIVSESVSWISGNYYLYNAVTILFTLILYSVYFQSKNKKHLWYSIIFYLVTMLFSFSLQMAIVLPVVLFITDQFFT